MISWKEEGFVIYDTCTCVFCKYFRFGIDDCWGIITDGKRKDGNEGGWLSYGE